MRFFALGLILLITTTALSQNREIDSLKEVLMSQEKLDKIQSLNELSWQYKNFNIDSAIYFGDQALQESLAINSKKGIAASYNSLASALQAKGQLDSALLVHEKSLEIKIQLDDSLGMADSFNNMGIAYDELGKYNLSLTHYFKALRLYESFSDQQFSVAMVLGNIGIVYKKQKEYEKVLEYYQLALNIYEDQKSDFGITVTKGNIGSVFLHLKKFKEAITFSEEAMEGFKAVGYLRYVPYMKSNMGIAYDSLGMILQARQLYLESIKEHQSYENDYELSNTLILLSANYNVSKDFKNSEQAAQRAYEIADKINALEFKSRALFEWARALAGNGNFQKAYDKISIQNSLKDSLFEENKTKQIFELQTQYETEKKEQQIVLQELKLAEQTADLQRNRILLIASILAIVFIVVLTLLQRSRIRKKQQLKLQQAQLHARETEINATISSQEKERARYARDLHDGFGQMISILNMNLKNLKDGAKPNERQEVFDASSKVIDDMYDELKNICFDLMPQTLIKHGLESALKEFTERINQPGKLQIELNTFGLEDRLTEIQEISLYRITQEWINNILKYSDATKVTLQITKDEGEITLLIEDDGSGFNKNLLISGKGNGWKNLNTRTNIIQGKLELETTPARKGNTLIVNAPSVILTSKAGNKNTVKTV
ncbi:tetratricopeptide repeat protein [Ekhidna sp.]|uniref:tetratricopeptide repeat-containing sensor histidine kinase n=1 Tax=Ekhidna sp. TaxID=2608089 RepID=UPI0032973EE2